MQSTRTIGFLSASRVQLPAKSNNISVSVIVPVFDGEKTIERALNSILAQTFTDFEIIVVDDASTDLTAELVSERYREQLKLIRHANNRGAAAARNTGIAAARGEWVAFLDSDDIWHEAKLTRQFEVLGDAGPRARGCATGYLLHKGGHDIQFHMKLDPIQFRREILFGCTISPGSTLLVDRNAFADIGPFDESLRRLEDWDWLLRFSTKYDLIFLPDVLADIYSGNRASSSRVEEALDRIRVKHSPRLSLLGKLRFRSSLLIEKSAMQYRAEHPGKAILYVLGALAFYPFRNFAFFRMLWRSVSKNPTPKDG
jgi:glycosyltransferase involved in cell wall biosynthesis